MSKQLIKYLLLIIGWSACLLGALGIVLPLLPATPFFILALLAFSKSSPRFHQWLLDLPGIGKDLAHWEKHKKIDKQRKPLIYLTIVISFFISILLLSGQFIIQVLLILMMFTLIFFIRKLPEY